MSCKSPLWPVRGSGGTHIIGQRGLSLAWPFENAGLLVRLTFWQGFFEQSSVINSFISAFERHLASISLVLASMILFLASISSIISDLERLSHSKKTISVICAFRGFTKFGIELAWRLQFLQYLRTLSLEFQKARTKIEVVLALPCWLS